MNLNARQTARLRRQMDDEGYTIVPNFLAEDLLVALRGIRADLGGDAQPHLGRVVAAERSKLFRPIILHKAQYDFMAEIGYEDVRFLSAYFISKPPGDPKLHWHQDWWGWSDLISYARAAPVVYLMYYLTDTDRSNGCLRVLPGSHRRSHKLHTLLAGRPTHPPQTLASDDVMLSIQTEEIDLPVSAGDLIIRDGRLLHASHANTSNLSRDLLILSFVPRWSVLSEQLRCAFDRKRHKLEGLWSGSELSPILERVALYAGSASPITLQRNPDFTS